MKLLCTQLARLSLMFAARYRFSASVMNVSASVACDFELAGSGEHAAKSAVASASKLIRQQN
jgi:hypothetical protein